MYEIAADLSLETRSVQESVPKITRIHPKNDLNAILFGKSVFNRHVFMNSNWTQDHPGIKKYSTVGDVTKNTDSE